MTPPLTIRKLENLVNMLFLVEVNTKYRTNLNELCMKNTTPHVGKLGQNLSSQEKSKTYELQICTISLMVQMRIDHPRLKLEKVPYSL